MPANRFYSSFDFEKLDKRPSPEGEYRNPFQIDRDRIIHSSAFRRLQSKTQVFLSGEYDFYRTRLTHSIEVAQIGRSICAWLTQQCEVLGDDCFIDPDLVESICLSHDLGHPPFGHAGERTLHTLMEPYGGFEGNAQTLRILTQTLFSEGRVGMNPSRALLDGVLKYKTLFAEKPAHKANHYLYNDQERWLDFTMGGQAFPIELTPGKERNGFKSIECQIMDWADDTAYSLNDLADGIHAGFINESRVSRWAADQTLSGDDVTDLEFLCKAMRDGRVEGRLNRLIGAGTSSRWRSIPSSAAGRICTKRSRSTSSSSARSSSSSITKPTSSSNACSRCYTSATSSPCGPKACTSCPPASKSRSNPPNPPANAPALSATGSRT
jgi:dGTPase